tara:strand:- start:5347 stop:5826 length:480 start_codon:yes stop_codon:yes gene_type:complete
MNTENENPIILDSEKLFANSINNYLNKNNPNWKIIKSNFKYCYMDFVLINLNNLYITHLEYKERSFSYGYTQYDSYFISLRKYEAIKKCYQNCYIVWDFTNNTKNDDEFFYIKYNEELFNDFEKDYNKSRLLIPSKFCKTTFENLMTEMIDAVPNRNLI